MSFYETPKLTITLDVPMKPVDENGNISEYVTEIQISGYEGGCSYSIRESIK
ncbi:hypothetical protein O9993_12035 [Vibrio lentus]|nr:hypothetical protein [Vibrio lentus]